MASLGEQEQAELNRLFKIWYEKESEVFKDYQFPAEILAKPLFEKIIFQILDCGDYFGIDTQQDPTLIYTNEEQMEPNSNVFITDHIWTPDPDFIYQEWKDSKELRERLDAYLENPDPAQEDLTLDERLTRCNGKNLDLDDLEIPSLADLRLSEKFPELETLSLWGAQLSKDEDIIRFVSELKNIKAIWLNKTIFEDSIKEEDFPNIQILNSKFTSNYCDWALCYLAKNQEPKTVAYLNLSNRNIREIKPSAFELFTNLAVLDISSNPVDVKNIKSIIPSLTSIKCDASDVPGLVFINGIDKEENELSLPIPQRIWDHIQPCGSRWGLGDEVYLSIHHSLSPNVASIPVINPLTGRTFCAFWPVSTIKQYDEITCDLYPLIPLGAPVTPRFDKLTPIKDLSSSFSSTVPSKRPLKIYTDNEVFKKNLSSPYFELCENKDEADVHWITFRGIYDYADYYKDKIYVNQVENEICITNKDKLFETISEFRGDAPYIPQTFLLTNQYEFARFIEADKHYKETNQSHVWVCKPFNEARASLITTTDQIGEVLRMATTGPRLVQRYLWNPLCIYEKKFDLRFIVLLKSVKPFELYAYKVFWPRLAPKKWALEDFSDYERHYTVMNYKAPEKVTHKTWKDFVEQFEIENPGKKWSDVLDNIYKCFKDFFLCGCQKMVPSPYTKGLFGVDLMLTKDYEPIILECNFAPDCIRACNLCPTFVNDCFEVLFIESPVTNDKVAKIA